MNSLNDRVTELMADSTLLRAKVLSRLATATDHIGAAEILNLKLEVSQMFEKGMSLLSEDRSYYSEVLKEIIRCNTVLLADLKAKESAQSALENES